jgi:sortase A
MLREAFARRSRPSEKPLIKAGQYLFLLLAIVCLGYYELNDARAWIFQTYESWRFDRIMNARRDRAQSNSPAMTSRGLAPAAPSLPEGTLVGRMEIPKIGISVMVLEGDSDATLKKGAGHVRTTPLPGGSGNVVIAGHRDTFFRALRKIQKHDEVTFTTTRGVHHYEVASIEEVGPKDLQVLQPTGKPTLTLITCYPFNYIGPAPMRFVVKASEV